MPILASLGSGAIGAYRMFRGGAAPVVNYIEDVFSTYLYTGNGSTQTITNGIDLSGKGGLVWIKSRSAGFLNNVLSDTVRGNTKVLYSNLTAAQDTFADGITAFNTTGFSLGVSSNHNESTYTFASWTFREQAKFFDVVTYTGNGANNRQISHNLGSAPGCIILKRTDGTGDWWTYHRSLGDVGGFSYDLQLNTTSNRTAYQIFGTASTQTSTYFTLGTVFANEMNGNGATYVAYLFAHDAGGFGATGSDNVISCGSFTCDGSGNADVTLGYEPQWLLVKPYDAAGYPWYMADIMRGMPLVGDTRFLRANTNGAETGDGGVATFRPTATGFQVRSFSQANIYIAIRRGPMKTPTSGTSVFTPTTWTSTNVDYREIDVGFAADMYYWKRRDSTTNYIGTRLQGIRRLVSSSTVAEASVTNSEGFDGRFQNSITASAGGATAIYNSGTSTNVFHAFRRAPGFFDVVCYTGNGSYPFTINHNLAVVPELMIFKSRNNSEAWWTIAQPITSPDADWYQNYLTLNSTDAASPDPSSFTTVPTSTTITASSYYGANGNQFVLYLFASCPGVSKVGSYTGTGTTKQIDCGFTSGARFVLIKRTDSTGDWYVWDSARGIIAGNDPYFLYNSAAVEVTGTDYIDTYSPGFEISSTAPAAINANGGTYIFLAIA